MANKFSQLTADFSPEHRASIEAKKNVLREAMNLAEMHQASAAFHVVKRDNHQSFM